MQLNLIISCIVMAVTACNKFQIGSTQQVIDSDISRITIC